MGWAAGRGEVNSDLLRGVHGALAVVLKLLPADHGAGSLSPWEQAGQDYPPPFYAAGTREV